MAAESGDIKDLHKYRHSVGDVAQVTRYAPEASNTPQHGGGKPSSSQTTQVSRKYNFVKDNEGQSVNPFSARENFGGSVLSGREIMSGKQQLTPLSLTQVVELGSGNEDEEEIVYGGGGLYKDSSSSLTWKPIIPEAESPACSLTSETVLSSMLKLADKRTDSTGSEEGELGTFGELPVLSSRFCRNRRHTLANVR